MQRTYCITCLMEVPMHSPHCPRPQMMRKAAGKHVHMEIRRPKILRPKHLFRERAPRHRAA